MEKLINPGLNLIFMLSAKHPYDAMAYMAALDQNRRVMSPSIFYGSRDEIEGTLDYYTKESILPRDFRTRLVLNDARQVVLPIGIPTSNEALVKVDVPHKNVPISVIVAAPVGYFHKLICDLDDPDARKRGNLYKLRLDPHRLAYVPESIVEALRMHNWDTIQPFLDNMEIERAQAFREAAHVMRIDAGREIKEQSDGLVKRVIHWFRGI